jgi:hypothetical protein
MDELVHDAGFEKTAMEIDPWGIFTVSIARRLGARVTPVIETCYDDGSFY